MDFRLILGCPSAVGKEFPVSYDFPIVQEYGETLDSANVIVRAREKDRIFDLEPYQEAELVGEGNSFRFLVDHFVENELRTEAGNKVYEYQIALMSETKILEKIQLPNTCYTHDKREGAKRKSVFDAVRELVDAYSPRVRALNPDGTYSLVPYLSVSTTADWSRMKNSPMADCSLSKPTLRQALTYAMSQCGCIPMVRKREVLFMDLRAEGTPFSDKSGRGFVAERSMASDSFVNSLVMSAENVIDEDGMSVSEQLCFRDRDHVLLKQKENLKLETRFPIYRVSKLVMNSYIKLQANLKGKTALFVDATHNTGVVFNSEMDEAKTELVISARSNVLNTRLLTIVGTLSLTATSFSVGKDGSSEFIGYETAKTSIPISLQTSSAKEVLRKVVLVSDRFKGDHYAISGTFTGEMSDGLVHVAFDKEPIFLSDAGSVTRYESIYSRNANVLSKVDISPLCVESMKRKNLEVDFTKMPSKADLMKLPIEDRVRTLGKWVYGTVQYAVGGKLITGFSETYTRSFGLFELTKTYVENIVEGLGFFTPSALETYGDYVDEAVVENIFLGVFKPSASAGAEQRNANYGLLFFDVEYVPMARIKDAKTKGEADFEIEQLDQSANGTSSYQSLSAVTQDKIDRLGNDALSIVQRVSDLSEAMPLNSVYEGRVVYRREMKIGRNCVHVVYRLAKDYVMKNYFSSIVTKYRAYQNVSYAQSVEREELVKRYLCFSKGSVDGVSFEGALSFSNEERGLLSFCDAILGEGKQEGAYVYNSGEMAYKGGKLYAITKNETFSIASQNAFSFAYSAFDNYLDGLVVDGKYYDEGGALADEKIGGLPQRGVALEGKNGSLVFFSPVKELESKLYLSHEEAMRRVRMTQSLPVIEVSSLEDASSRFAEGFYDFPYAFHSRPKDNAERIVAWERFEAFSPDIEGLSFGKWAWRFSSALGGKPIGELSAFQDGSEAKDEISEAPSPLVKMAGKISCAVSNGGKTLRFSFSDAGGLDPNAPLTLSYVDAENKRRDVLSCAKASDVLGGFTASLSDKKGIGVFSFSGEGVMAKTHEADLTLRGRAKKR